MFGSPNELSDRLDGTVDFRRNVEQIAGRSTSPTDPTESLALITETIHDRIMSLDLSAFDGEVGEYQSALAEYADKLTESVREETDTVGVLSETMGSEYAEFMEPTRYVRNEFRDEFSEPTPAELEEVFELLESIAIARQFFKTLAIQQQLARLSRFFAYTGLWRS
ncbi:hypothetical protein [Haladaptatus sp. NG-WS-4]